MYDKVLMKIRPSKDENFIVSKKVKEFVSILNRKLNGGICIVGGSFAKGTWLSDNHDIDIFACFENSKNMSKRVESKIKSCFKTYEVIHGSRDYFIVEFKNLNFEVVPVLKIKKAASAENITDVSPMHVDWVKKNTNERLKDEIRLAKQFLRANNCYGAETYIGGFSGYLVELLVVYYKGFNNFIKNGSKWKFNKIINIEGNNEFINEQKFPLIVIDPVQPNRNAAAALRKNVFDNFVKLCSKFNGDDSWFEEKRIKLDRYDLVLRAKPLDGFSDVVGTKMLKVFERIKKGLDSEGFGVKNSGWFWKDDGYFYFNLKNKVLSKNKKHLGPPLKFIVGCERFKKKYKKYKVVTERGKLFVNLPRRFTKAGDFVKYMIKDKEIKNKVKSMKILKAKAI